MGIDTQFAMDSLWLILDNGEADFSSEVLENYLRAAMDPISVLIP